MVRQNPSKRTFSHGSGCYLGVSRAMLSLKAILFIPWLINTSLQFLLSLLHGIFLLGLYLCLFSSSYKSYWLKGHPILT